MEHSQTASHYSRSFIKTVLLSILLVGTLDLLSAYVDVYLSTGKNSFISVSKYIASGWVGKAAFDGGTGMVILGIVSHFIVVSFFTTFFFWLFPRIPFWSQNRIITGILYGFFMWSVMTFIVVPLSNVPPRQSPIQWDRALKAIAILIVMIGWPLSFIAASYFKKNLPLKAGLEPV